MFDRHFLIERSSAYIRLMRINRPIGTLLLLWPTLWALWIASQGHPDTNILIVFLAGVFLMRAAGCVINDYADRGVDPFVSRTATRPLVTGEVRPREALILCFVLVTLAFGLVLMMNLLTIALSLVAVALAGIYPFMKRFTYLPQVHLGMAFGWAVPMSFAAQTGTIPTVGWLLLLAVISWAVAYDTMYAMVDRADDIQIGVKSTAILFADADRIWIGVFQGIVIIALIIVGYQAELGPSYYIGLGFASLLFAYQQYLIRDREPQNCFKAFLNNNWLGASVFVGIMFHYLFN